ncbi:uncharacterized protein LOC133920683 [Phragmites australis]|uniref:uncharacterized protein LOC133920683 n=1 Tax=Phragmites australis TaxID=29695 RepID=UPI002D767160|nr:uncharacterized protein LOC133920683 [Phragmites australis]
MASAGDDIAEAEAARKSAKRISDFLGDSDGDEAAPPHPETPPRLRLPRFTCARIRFGRLGRKRGGSSGEKCEEASVDSSGWKPAGNSSAGTSAEAGMGLSMLLFLSRTRVELNRMAEVRAEMETLLKEIRDEASKMKSADHVLVTPRTCNLQSSSAASSSCTSDTNTNCLEIARRETKPSEDERCARMHVLELEDDPETERQLLECKCNADQETSESSSDEEFIELDGGRFRGCGGGNPGRDAGDDDSGNESWDRRDGVSAIELERRLHELLHRRNRARIEELESALRHAKRKLVEKEMEARMWQDTAALALGQPPVAEQ